MIEREAVNNVSRMLDAARQNANSDLPPVVAVVGAFSRGKSALLNALLDTPLLPVHPLPTTAVPTRITYADRPSARLLYADHEQNIPVEKARTISAYRGSTDGLCEIRIEWPCNLLKGGLTLLDTPGIDALAYQCLLPYNGREGVARELGSPLPSAGEGPGVSAFAALLFVFAADPPLGEAELDFLREIAPTVPRIVLVQTKCDVLTEPELPHATIFNRAAIDSAYPALSNTPIFSVSALTGAGIATLRDTVVGWDAAVLCQERGAWQVNKARTQAQILMDMLQTKRTRLAAVSMVLKDARATCMADLDTIRAGALATLARLSDYTLGNLSATIYRTDPIELTGGRGLGLAANELRHVRDQLANEVERALIESRRRLIDSLAATGLPIDLLPKLPVIILPDPQTRTVSVRITERRAFRPQQLDAEQTIKAYRTAVAHMTDAYSAELMPPLELFLSDYYAALIGILDKIGAEFDTGMSDVSESIDALTKTCRAAMLEVTRG